MPKVIGLKTLRLISKDVAGSKLFYQKFFDAPPFEEQENFVSFRIGHFVLDICFADEKNPTSTGGSISYWEVDDLEFFINRALNLGGEIFRGPLEVKEINTRIVQIKDPAGSVIGLEQKL